MRDVWEIKAASHDRKGKYEVAPKSAVFKRLEPEYRQTTLICLFSQAYNHAGCQPLNLFDIINVLFQVRCSRLCMYMCCIRSFLWYIQ